MAIPDTPYTRTEMYLDAIARGSGGGGSSGGGVLVCSMDMQTFALDKTWQEIHDAPLAVLKMDMLESDGMARTFAAVIERYKTDASGNLIYCVLFAVPNLDESGDTILIHYEGLELFAASPDGYPSMQMPSGSDEPQQ